MSEAFEGGGLSHRELYGKELIAHLSNRLMEVGIKGCSRTNLRKFRQFYQAFRDIPQTLSAHSGQPEKIQQPVSVESFAPDTFAAAESMTELAARFTLSWSHYVALVIPALPSLEKGTGDADRKRPAGTRSQRRRQ